MKIELISPGLRESASVGKFFPLPINCECSELSLIICLIFKTIFFH
ncbi:MAG: hypothetical protein JSV88_00465 [Candidatus Aminicenantes bacterium]|nr:MAG: hypothetical protein JSV88_00465 [Candidatus Aminicenantes bacterium]